MTNNGPPDFDQLKALTVAFAEHAVGERDQIENEYASEREQLDERFRERRAALKEEERRAKSSLRSLDPSTARFHTQRCRKGWPTYANRRRSC